MLTRSKLEHSRKRHLPSLLQRTTYSQASLQEHHWRQAMEVEYTTLLKTNTWTLVPPPPHGNVISCKWVFKLKSNQMEALTAIKLDLLQRLQSDSGVDYFETFSRWLSLRPFALYGLKQAPERGSLSSAPIYSSWVD
ncbi:putative mitochondrial protein [Vitis vinifera]|uniref:Putative mitochondrial protein n=1 Tax=Vitis vinifera TaxID=29760 RepID=A0A438HWT5_VITVI|nr:putative mitochondrial protein [Vitis vinifera]